MLSELTLQSTHALAREPRFAFLSFGMETIRSSYLDSFCENLLRESLYTVAYNWFATRPQWVLPPILYQNFGPRLFRWTYGASLIQVASDVNVLSDFMSHLQADFVHNHALISSLSLPQLACRGNCACDASVNLLANHNICQTIRTKFAKWTIPCVYWLKMKFTGCSSGGIQQMILRDGLIIQ